MLYALIFTALFFLLVPCISLCMSCFEEPSAKFLATLAGMVVVPFLLLCLAVFYSIQAQCPIVNGMRLAIEVEILVILLLFPLGLFQRAKRKQAILKKPPTVVLVNNVPFFRLRSGAFVEKLLGKIEKKESGVFFESDSSYPFSIIPFRIITFDPIEEGTYYIAPTEQKSFKIFDTENNFVSEGDVF